MNKITRKDAKQVAALRDEAVDFLTELRGLIFGSGILDRPRTQPMTAVVVMGLTMMSAEVTINNLKGKETDEMTPAEVNKFLHLAVDGIIPVLDEEKKS